MKPSELHLKRVLIESYGFTSRQVDVTELVTKGLSNKEISNQLFIKEKTVKLHLKMIYLKLGVKSRAQCIVKCLPWLSYQYKEIVNSNLYYDYYGINPKYF